MYEATSIPYAYKWDRSHENDTLVSSSSSSASCQAFWHRWARQMFNTQHTDDGAKEEEAEGRYKELQAKNNN